MLALLAECKLPELTPKVVKQKVEDILKAHVSYQELNLELMARVIQNYIEELDPAKTYFLEEEISLWTEPSLPLLEKAGGVKESDCAESLLGRRNINCSSKNGTNCQSFVKV